MTRIGDLTYEERRARREARRERQRAENVVRAREMHQARLAREAENDKTAAHCVATSKNRRLAAHIGCSGWFYWHWRNDFYPEGMPTSRWFDHYASQFRTVELNASFYSWPKVSTVETWLRQAARRRSFVYTIKANEMITHTKRFARTRELVRDFYLIGELLETRMGCFLFQLPPNFHYSLARLKRIVEQLDPRWKNVVEFRHRSWWNERVYAAFRERGLIFCSCSGPRLPDELIRTGDDLYIRFHGTKRWYRHDYTKEEISVWAQRIRASGAKRLWAYFNNDRGGYAIKNARELLRQLKCL